MKMHPFFVRNRMSAYLEDHLEPEEQKLMEDAFEEHTELREELESMQVARRLLKQAGKTEPPEELYGNIMAAIEEEVISPSIWPKVNRYTLLAAAAALLLVMLPWTTEHVPNPQTVETAQLPSPLPIILPTALPPTEEPEPVVVKKKPVSKPMKSSSKRRKPKRSAKFVPAEPYVADWEVSSSVPQSRDAYQISFAQDKILFQIAHLSEMHQGTLRSPNGTSFRPYTLTADRNYQKFDLLVPVEHWESIDSGLRQLGALFPKNKILAEQNMALFPIEVNYSP